MAVIPAASLQEVGYFIFQRLRQQGNVRYKSDIGGGDRDVTLREAFDMDDDRSFPEDTINWAVVILEEWLIVEAEEIGPRPCEFMLLKLTEKGKTFLAAGREFKYWDLDL